MNRHPVAYLRRSTADADSPGDVSRSVQETTVRELAQRDGFTPADLHVYTDWAKSADEEKASKRTQYAKMLEEIEAGHVCCVYAYSLDRLNRSLVMTARFAKACEANDVKIVTLKEGEVRQDTPAEWLRWTILATFGEYELRTIKSRAASALDDRRRRGDRLGQAPYGYKLGKVEGRTEWVRDEAIDLEAVRRAYVEAGSVLGACGKLEEWGIAAPRGGSSWSTSMVTRTIEREWPEILAPKTPLGRRRSKASAMFAQLLRCPFCDRMLTPNTARGQYYCANGPRHRDTHPRYAVREDDVVDWIVAEADRLEIPADAVQLEGVEAKQDEIEAKWRRARAIYVDAGDEDAYEAARARYKADMADLEGQASTAMVAPVVDWDVEPETINAALRSMWRGVNLGPDLLPVSAEWIRKDWRRSRDVMVAI